MKKYLLFISLLSVSNLFSQKSEQIDLSKLSAPAIPAFTILGVQPVEISRPKTLDALETSVYSNFTKDGNLTFPKNYALEFTPYWLKAKPQITFNEYINPTPGQSPVQNLAFSFASYEQQSYADTSQKNLRMGVGCRSMLNYTKFIETDDYVRVSLQLYKGMASTSILLGKVTMLDNDLDIINKNYIYLKSSFDAYISGLDQEQRKEVTSLANEFIYKIIEENKEHNAKEILKIINENLSSEIEKTINSETYTDTISKIINDRYGLNIELAAAFTLDFPTNDVYFSKVPKFGFWITPSYKLSGKNINWLHKFELLAVGRFIKNYLPGNYSDNYDLGGKIVFETGKFTMSGELVQRFQTLTISSETINGITTKTTQSVRDFKATLNLDYKLNDKVVLTYSFGKNYELYTENKGNLISMLSINYGLGKISTRNFKPE
jgi:hypothetical protein